MLNRGTLQPKLTMYWLEDFSMKQFSDWPISLNLDVRETRWVVHSTDGDTFTLTTWLEYS